MAAEIHIRECTTVDELDACIGLQQEAFELPDLEISPRRHLIVSRQVGGWTLGAFESGTEQDSEAERLVGFVHHMAAVRGNDEIFGYSHMMAVAVDCQNKGVGARLKWAQRERALAEGRSYIRWTWEPMRARNAHFNLNRLGVIVETYAENFYGSYYGVEPQHRVSGAPSVDSDRLFASWYLRSERVNNAARGSEPDVQPLAAARVTIPANWMQLLQEDPAMARQEQLRVREEFNRALGEGLVCAAFDSDRTHPTYLFFERNQI